MYKEHKRKILDRIFGFKKGDRVYSRFHKRYGTINYINSNKIYFVTYDGNHLPTITLEDDIRSVKRRSRFGKKKILQS